MSFLSTPKNTSFYEKLTVVNFRVKIMCYHIFFERFCHPLKFKRLYYAHCNNYQKWTIFSLRISYAIIILYIMLYTVIDKIKLWCSYLKCIEFHTFYIISKTFVISRKIDMDCTFDDSPMLHYGICFNKTDFNNWNLSLVVRLKIFINIILDQG